MKSTLLATKLHRPALPGRLVERPNLVQHLADGLAYGHPLTLVSAPAGFGKSTLVIEWIESIQILSPDRYKTAWFSLDPADNDPLRFFAYFIAALQQAQPDIGQEIEAALLGGQLPAPETILTVLVNDLSASPVKILLVLDDFHLIQETVILAFLEKILSNPPEALRLVLVSREDPLLPLGRLRANGQLTEIRAGDLRFSENETHRLLTELLGLPLTREDIANLEARTEGWIVGLQLAGLSMRDRPDLSGFIASLRGSHRYFLAYLTEEVLDRQPPEIQKFLLQTSILKQMCAPLCDALRVEVREESPENRDDDQLPDASRPPNLDPRSSQSILEYLERANLFLVSLDDEQHWYRYHHLFGDLLRTIQTRLAKDEIDRLHQRASRWYEGAGLVPEAIQHALECKDFSRAIRLLDEYALPILMQGDGRIIENWMETIPREFLEATPRINLAFAWTHLLRGSYARIPAYLDKIETTLRQADLRADAGQAIRAEWAALQSNLLHMQGKIAESIEQGRLALELSDPGNNYLLGLVYLGLGGAYRQAGDYDQAAQAYQLSIQASRACDNLTAEMLALGSLGLEAVQHGQLRFAHELCTQALDRLERSGRSSATITGAVHGALGRVYHEWGMRDKAETTYISGARKSTLSGHNAALMGIKTGLSRLYLGEGNLAAAMQAVQEAAEMLADGGPAWMRSEIAEQMVRVQLAQDDLAGAENTLVNFGAHKLDQAVEMGGLYGLAWLRVLLRRGQPGDLETGLALGQSVLDQAEPRGQTELIIQACLLRGLAFAALGQRADSLREILRAVSLGEADGYLRAYLDQDPSARAEMQALLAQIHKQLAHPAGTGDFEMSGLNPTTRTRLADYVRRILANFPTQTTPDPSPPALAVSELVEPLADREIEVLHLLAGGLKYEEIAARLYISVNTVRFYVKGAYGKLNANNKTMAIEAARQLGLIK